MTACSATDDATRRGHSRDVPLHLMSVPATFPVGKVANYLELQALAARRDLPANLLIPVLQGFSPAEYERCRILYACAGVDLATLPRVGLGSICRRQAEGQIEGLVRELASGGLRLHAFGCKTGGLARYAHHLASADSLAWSFRARRSQPLPGCVGRHKNCANCLTYATAWRARLLTNLPDPQPSTGEDHAA